MDVLKNKYFLIIALSILALTYSIIRPVNIDEGYYIASAQEVLEGKLLYKDFIFHQMPLTIYIYSLISDHGYWSLIFGRILSVSFISISAVLLFSLLKRITGRKTSNIFIILFFLNSFFIDWSVLIRIYALSVLVLSFGVYSFYCFLENTQKSYHLFFSILAFTLLVFTKVTLVSSYITLIIFIKLFCIKYNRNVLKLTLIFISASLIPVISFLFIFEKSLDEFYYSVFYFNYITKEYIDAPFTISLLKYIGFFLLPQNIILLTVILISGFKFTFFEKFLIANILCFTLIHIPSRMLMEYFCSINPLLILLSCLRYQKFADIVMTKWRVLSVKHIYTGLVILYLLSAPFGLIHLKNIIEGTELLMNPVELYSFEQKVNSLKGNTVLSSWEGYSIFSCKTPILKNQYGAAFINKYVSENDLKKYNIAEQKDYEKLLTEQTPDIIIYDNSNSAHMDNLKDIISRNYNKAFQCRSVEVFSK